MKKRFLCVIALVIAAVMTVLSVPVTAAGSASQDEFSLTSAAAKPGETVKLTLKAASTVGVSQVGVALEFDETKIEFVGYSDYGEIVSKAYIKSFDQEKHAIVMAFLTAQLAPDEIVINDTICVVEFRIKSGAAGGDTTIKVKGVAKNAAGDLAVSNVNGVITIEGSTPADTTDTGDPGMTVDTEKSGDPDVTEEWKNPFNDVFATDPYYEAVKYVYVNGIFNGVAADRFAPASTMTRAMFVTVLGRIEGVDQNNYPESTFKDVEQGTWYTPYVSWANEFGIVKGYDSERFGPNNQITIEQAVVIIGRFARYTGNLTEEALKTYLCDTGMSVSDWALEDMCWALAEGIYKPAEGASPQDPAPRSLIAEMLFAFQNWRTK